VAVAPHPVPAPASAPPRPDPKERPKALAAPRAASRPAPASEPARPEPPAHVPEPVAPAPASAPVPAAPLAEPAPAIEVAPVPPPRRGARARIAAPDARVRNAAGQPLDDWQAVGSEGLVVQAVDARGVSVKLRLFCEEGRFLANLNAQPAAVRVLLDDRDMGGTPIARLPLGTGRRHLRVEGTDGQATNLTLDLDP
jgi:hypothetical protein